MMGLPAGLGVLSSYGRGVFGFVPIKSLQQVTDGKMRKRVGTQR